ncbi:SHOCT domain-containing protein [Microbacterium aurum]
MREDTEAALKTFEVNTFGRAGILSKLEEKLAADEAVIYIAPTNATVTTTASRKTEKLPGAIALTSKRVLFTYKVLLDHKTISVDLAQVHSVTSSGNSLTGGHIQILTVVNTIDFLVKYKKESIAAIQEAFEAAIAGAKAPQGAGSPDVLAQIQKLAELHTAGVLTETEFSEKKAELLGRL